MDKFEIAQILREIGILVELTAINPKKAIAYKKAARTLETIEDLSHVIKHKELEKFPGIGSGIAEMIITLSLKGQLPYYETLKNSIPSTLLEMVGIPGLSIQKIRFLYEKLHITNLSELETILRSEILNNYKGNNLGPTIREKILKKIDFLKTSDPFLLYYQALHIGEIFIEILKPLTKTIELTGTLRRRCEIISEIEWIATAKDPIKCISDFSKHGLVKKILKTDKSSASVVLKQGIKATLHITSKQKFPIDLFKTTGNSGHVSKLQKEASKKGVDINTVDSLKYFQDENQLYHFFNLPFIPPELRENLGEIEAGRQKKLPILIEYGDLKGTFHCHTKDSDGENSLEEMAYAARDLGWQYMGISDHSKSSYQANGMNEERLFNQMETIRLLNNDLGNSFHVFSGVECDILKDGKLDFSNDILKHLDFVIISIHRFFSMEKSLMTKRLIKAIENPYTTLVGHLTGRLLKSRDPYQINIPKVIDACIANGKIIELNSSPSRLDMDWRLWIKAKEKGLKCSINPDAHSINELMNCQFGIHIARKGWLEKNDVINTLPLNEMKRYLKEKK